MFFSLDATGFEAWAKVLLAQGKDLPVEVLEIESPQATIVREP